MIPTRDPKDDPHPDEDETPVSLLVRWVRRRWSE